MQLLEKKGIDQDLQIGLCNEWLNNKDVECIDNVDLSVSFDMAWQKRGSGSRYDSISGHAIMIGCLTKKVIGLLVYAMKCTKCHAAQKMYACSTA